MNHLILTADKLIAGVDEVGRGPLAGPVVAAAVILDPERSIPGLTDSKKLSNKKREYFALQIQENAYAIGIGSADVHEIDKVNILQATFLAMQRAISDLGCSPGRVLVDGNQCPELSCTVEAIINGDCLEPAISAASIIAKVHRDNLMYDFDKEFPDYGFAGNKGYPTREHINALNALGPTRIHRRSFKPVANCLGQ
ncbi:ribonuclease HII [Methylohalomonas lacus]|uniref:Ribonuclease HII n=1 Tax=Methylohalomonas lacus TaxID=398773 RepID=A0AAE3L123_9GAMM|nr:ribonuclease HII [Methylohalomonas lacus]MCS3902531.1 ribonuclease HII [Methylohalomonas lacus]